MKCELCNNDEGKEIIFLEGKDRMICSVCYESIENGDLDEIFWERLNYEFER